MAEGKRGVRREVRMGMVEGRRRGGGKETKAVEGGGGRGGWRGVQVSGGSGTDLG